MAEQAGARNLEAEDVRADLFTSSTKKRISRLNVLQDDLLKKELSPEAQSLVLTYLTATYPLYIDRASRSAAQDCLRTIVSSPEPKQYWATVTKFLEDETRKPALAPASLFVLVEWCSVLLQVVAAKPQLWQEWGMKVIKVQAQLFERCCGSGPKEGRLREGRIHSAQVATRRAIRSLAKSAELKDIAIKDVISTLTVKGAASTAGNAPLLGVIAGVCDRLTSVRPVLEENASAYYGFYTREILASRTIVPPHIANGLHDFFASSIISLEAVEQEVVPAAEKALLRAPEVVLNDVLSPFFTSVPATFDLSKALKDRLMKPLLSAIKSTNPAVRDGALRAFRAISQKCKDRSIIAAIADELLKNLKETKAADQRTSYAQLMDALPASEKTVQTILPAVLTLASKEANEGALNAELDVVSCELKHAFLQDLSIDAAVAKSFATGLADKKQSVRRTWATHYGSIAWDLEADVLSRPASLQFLESVTEKLSTSWDESLANPITATQNGLITTAYVLYAVGASKLQGLPSDKIAAVLKKANLSGNVLGSEAKPSFLVNHRVYTKLSTPDDLVWLVRALGAATNEFTSKSAPTGFGVAWAQAVIYMITSTSVPPTVRQETSKMLRSAWMAEAAAVSGYIVEGLWAWLKSVDLEEKDSAATSGKADVSRLHLVLNALCAASPNAARANGAASNGHTEDNEAEIRNLLTNLIVLCREPLLPRVRWIDLCLQSGVDPRTVVTENPQPFIDEILERTSHKGDAHQDKVHAAACHAAAELAFVAPETVMPLLIDIFAADLDTKQLENIGPTEAAIFRTPEGTAFVDVLASKQPVQPPSKNTKDYDLMKWEQELRAQLAEKQGKTQKKLTADEQSKVKAQLAREATIRQEVAAIVERLQRGLGIISSLAIGPPTDAQAWMGPAIHGVFGSIKSGAGLLVGYQAAKTYLDCAGQVSARLGPLRQFIGVATLRAQGSSKLPPEYEAEPLGDLVTRVLYRLRFASEQRPFDVVSLVYLWPLLATVLRNGGIDRAPGEEADEQITLAIETLSYHTDLFSSHELPRQGVLELLISSMRKYNQHYRPLRDCLMSICQAIALDATSEEVSVFLKGSIVPETSVRQCALQSIDNELDLEEGSFVVEIWLASHEDDEENAEIARTIWDENSLQTNPDASFEILEYLQSLDAALRRAAAKALTACVKNHIDVFPAILKKLQELYIEKAKPVMPERDKYGMPLKMDLADPWAARHGIALAVQSLAQVFDENELVNFIRFLVETGPVADRDSRVRDQMVQAATQLIAQRGSAKVEELMTIFESTLEAPNSASKDADLINEAVIIMYGALARHLKAGDSRIPKVVNRLLVTLSTPSETVQYAIAGCLPPLVQTSAEEMPDYVSRVMADLLEAKKYATRRGAAYGLAGLVRGKGISSLREFRILSSLRAASEEKKDTNKRQGAFLAYELLSLVLGPVFEPYVLQIVPQLIAGFGDQSADVREACLDAAKTCFATLSSFGVKQVLPILLEGLEETQWRSKKGACDSLGAMAYLDPQQLSVSLPEIIPHLTEVLNDSHKEVRASANRSLQRFGEVISNPEIKSVVDILLKALSDPTKYTDDALTALLKLNFVHYLDAPSLALVVRILERGLGDRSATKRNASQIIGSLAHLTERKDLSSHLPVLVSGLRVAAVDPVPTTRATASKALGSLVEKLGEDALPDLIPSLMSTLKTDTGAGDRLGSAQALSEVLAGLGTSRLEETLPSILQNVASTKPAVREGFMSLFIYLPACFGNSFAPYLSKIIPPILAGLADDVESIRETSLRAGRLLVKNFATRAIDLLLPELQRGLADNSHRIRLSSVELVGDLLFNLTGITAKAEAEGDEMDEQATAAGQNLLEVLGEDKRNNILSALYIARCDTSGLVRTAAVNVWKALVATPRTLREITPVLTQHIIRRLASSNMEQKEIAGNALGELIRKAGEGVLATLLPTLEEGLQSSVDADAKQGICIALRELITSASPDTLEDFEPKLISVVRTALVDSNVDVREAAAEAFDALQQVFGKKAVDHILPDLLGLLRNDEDAQNALAALLTLLTDATRSNIILPTLLPTLLASPISAFNARAIASLASVAGSAMTRRLSRILESLLDNIISCKDEERKEALDAAFDSVLLSVDEYDGLNTSMSIMLGFAKHDDHRRRRIADEHFAHFFAHAEMDFSRYYADLIRALLISFDDRDSEVVKAAWSALSTLVGKLRKEDMESLVQSTRQVLGQVGVPGHHLPGFLLPKGINAVLPIFLQGLTNGTPEQRTQAALAISDIIDRTSADALKPFVTQITGPLIRVVSERSVDVKAAILLTLNNLLEKIPTFLKPFLPQLQRTFTKALADTSSDILRTRAAKALGTLITMTPRIDPLIAELVTGSRTADAGVKTAMQKALYEVVSKVGANMNEASRTSILSLIDEDTGDTDEAGAITNARLLGALIKNLSPEVAASLMKSRVLTAHFSRPSVLALNAILLESPETLTSAFDSETVSTIVRGIASAEDVVAENCILAAGKYLLTPSSNKSFEVGKTIFEAFVPVLQPGTPIDRRRLALVVIRTVSRQHEELIRPHIVTLASPVFANVRDMVLPIKLAAEAAFTSIFCVVEEENAVFDKYIAGSGAGLPPQTKRSMQEYFKRVALRLGSQARERKEAEGGQGGLGLSGDEMEDEREVWSVGRIELGEVSFDG